MNPVSNFFHVDPKRTLLIIVYAVLVGGCSLAPNYKKPSVETPAAFKEVTGATNIWQVAKPNDAVIRGKWWEMFNEPELNALEEQVTVSNQNVVAAFDNFLAAHALVREARAQYFPTLVTSPSVTRSRASQSLGNQNPLVQRSGVTVNDFTLPLDASWQPDLWGRVRNTVKANAAAAQASAADLENTRLTAQGELAADYFQLRSQDSLKQLFDDTVKAYRESFELEKVLFKTGLASDQDVAQAETQLETAQAADTNLGI
jgi:outer membrane protein TolC